MPKERENGRRRYDGEVLDRLVVVRVAQQAGFTVSEIRTLLNGFSEHIPPSERWRLLTSHDTREPLYRCGRWLQPIAFRLRFFQAATSRLRRRMNAANSSPVNRA